MQTLPDIQGLGIRSLTTIEDSRGNLTEIFRENWFDQPTPVQWNFVRSIGNVLRGFHVHYTHADYLILLEGRMRLGVKDLRPESETYGLSGIVELYGEEKQLVSIQPGIGHGFYFPIPSLLTYGLSCYWNIDDEMGCSWDADELGIDWQVRSAPPFLSDRDASAMSYAEMITVFNQKWTASNGR